MIFDFFECPISGFPGLQISPRGEWADLAAIPPLRIPQKGNEGIAAVHLAWDVLMPLPLLFFFLFLISTPTSPSRTRPKTGLGVLGDEPCRLNGTTQALGEPVEVNHLRRTIHRVPRGSHPPDRPSGLTLPLRPSASHHRQRIPVRQLSEDYIVPDNLGQHPGPGLVTPYLNRRGAHSKHMPQASMLYWVAKSSRASLMPSCNDLISPT